MSDLDSPPRQTVRAGRPFRSTPAFGFLLFACVFMVFGLCVLLFIGRDKARILGAEIADLDIRPLLNTSEPISPTSMKGKVVVLHFWGTWCSHCADEFPDIVQVQRKYQTNQEVLFASISCGPNSPEDGDELEFYTRKYMREGRADELPVYCDPVEFSRTRISKLMTKGGFRYPTTIVIDREGKVADIWAQVISKETLEKAIEAALKKPFKGPGLPG